MYSMRVSYLPHEIHLNFMNMLLMFIIALAHHPTLSYEYPKLSPSELSKHFEEQEPGTIHQVNVDFCVGSSGNNLLLPVFLLKGAYQGKKLVITAAIHGDEVTGVPVANKIVKTIDVEQLHGEIVSIPVLNPFGFAAFTRGGTTGKDINRSFKKDKLRNVEEHYARMLLDMFEPFKFDYHVDLHTATAGHDNSFYVRADLKTPGMMDIAGTLRPQIILNVTSPEDSLRGAMLSKGVQSVTVEMGGPNKVNEEFERKGVESLQHLLHYLDMTPDAILTNESGPKPVVCSKSKWVYSDYGGTAFLKVGILSMVSIGQTIAEIRDFHGNSVSNVTSDRDGIVIGKNNRLAVEYGSRLVHVGTVAS